MDAESIERDPIFGCELWTGTVNNAGYPMRWVNGRSVGVARELYAERHGPIAEGMELEHLCRRRNCLADVHHELLTRSQQERAKSWASRCRRTTCKAGHDMRVNVAVTPEGGRTCRTCNSSSRMAPG